MAKIKSITLKNIKFFGEPQTIELGGKHTLIYGENGSGKSSLYWALYRILASANKIEEWEIEKYFEPVGEYSWLNVYEVAKGNSDAEISLLLDDNSTLKLTQNDFSINQNTDAQEANMASEFLSYKFLYKLLDFTASEDIDLFGVFYQQLFPYIRFQSVTYWRENKTTQLVESFTASNALQIYNFVNNGPQKIYPNRQGELRFPSRTSQPFIDYKDIVDGFEASMHQTMSLINVAGNPILKNSLGNNITFEIKFVTVKPYQLSATNFEPPEYKIELIITDYEGMGTVIKKPHVFLNEAKLTAVGLAIRLAVLKQRLQTAKLKILVLDDLLISLDMSNREKVLRVIIENYSKYYQILFLTHQRNLFEDAKNFIAQYYSELAEKEGMAEPDSKNYWQEYWKLLEMYEGENTNGIPTPKILLHESNIQKAYYYFKEHIDYNACGNNLRAALEGFFKDFLPHSFRDKSKAQDAMLDALLVDAKKYFEYVGFDLEIINQLRRYLKRSLNKSSHHNPKAEFYKGELREVFKLYEELNTLRNTPILKTNALLTFTVKSESENLYKYTVKLMDCIRLYNKGDDTESFFLDKDKRSYGMISYAKNGESKNVNGEKSNLTLQELYDFTIETVRTLLKEKPIVEVELYDIFKDINGVSLAELKNISIKK